MRKNLASKLPQLIAGILLGTAISMVILWGLPERPAREEQTSNEAPDQLATMLDPGEHAPKIGALAPPFVLDDLNGLPHALDDYRGQVVLLNFWATWCAPCRLEMPLLEKLAGEFAEHGLVVLGINYLEPAGPVRAFVEEVGLSFPILLDEDGAISGSYRIRGYPSTILIDANGRIQTIHIGIITETQLLDFLQQAGITT